MRGPEYCFADDLKAGRIRWSILWNRYAESGALMRAATEDWVVQKRPEQWYAQAQIDLRNGDVELGGLILKAIRDLRAMNPRCPALRTFF